MKTTLPYLILLIVLCSCGQLSEESKQWREDFRAATTTLEKSADKLALSVPGERYLRLIEEVRSGDPDKQARAKAFVEDLFKIDIDKEYEASIWFGYHSDTQIMADAFRSYIDGKIAVEHHIQNKRYNPTLIGNSFVRPRTTLEIFKLNKKIINKAVLSFKVHRHAEVRERGEHGFFWGENLFSRGGKGNRIQGNLEEEFHNDLRTVANALNAAARNYFTENRITYTDKCLTLDWSVVDPSALLFVLIRKSDWDRLPDGIRVAAVVHVRGQPQNTLAQDRVYTFRKEEFKEYRTEHPAVQGGAVMYAAHNMTGFSFISEDAIAAKEKLAELLKRYGDSPDEVGRSRQQEPERDE